MLKQTVSMIALFVLGITSATAAIALVPMPTKASFNKNYETDKIYNELQEVTLADIEENGMIMDSFDDIGKIPLDILPKLDPIYLNSVQLPTKKKNRAAEVPPRHRPRFGG